MFTRNPLRSVSALFTLEALIINRVEFITEIRLDDMITDYVTWCEKYFLKNVQYKIHKIIIHKFGQQNRHVAKKNVN